VKARFPSLVFRTTTQAAEILRQFLASDWQTDISAERVVVEGPVGGFFRLLTNGECPGRRRLAPGPSIGSGLDVIIQKPL